MKHVYLIRHGLPDFPNGKRMCLGRTDLPLCPKGHAQAKEMVAKLPPVTSVYSSPLIRAVQTAQAIGLPVTILEDLQELSAGEWDGLTFDEIRLRYPELYAARATDRTLPLPGAEDNEAGLSRFQKAMTHAVSAAEGDLAVVAHGGVIALFLQDLGGRWYKPGYAQIVPLLWDNGTFIIEEEFDYA
ncbi:MAG: histidine phosphatase family protein [Oscillospiraceae bacterium]|nr:histidine phosphatase family protein [Oscillospiraceae bacterium]